jgi:hypothetical protein
MSTDLYSFQQEGNVSGSTIKREIGNALGGNTNSRSVLFRAIDDAPEDDYRTHRTSTDTIKDAFLQTVLPENKRYIDDPILQDSYYNGGIPQLPQKSGVLETRMIEDDLVVVLIRVDAASGKQWYVMDFVRPNSTDILRCFFDIRERKAYLMHLMPIYANQRNSLLQTPHVVKSIQMLKAPSHTKTHEHRQFWE